MYKLTGTLGATLHIKIKYLPVPCVTGCFLSFAKVALLVETDYQEYLSCFSTVSVLKQGLNVYSRLATNSVLLPQPYANIPSVFPHVMTVSPSETLDVPGFSLFYFDAGVFLLTNKFW